MKKIRPEILAPAGTMAAMQAAVAAGADAIYFGLERHNARERATNFTLARLPEIMAGLHLRGVKGYVTFNTLIYESELEDAEAMLRAIASAGVDAVIVQDIGVARMVQRLCPTLHVHASTQMTITDAASAEVARSLGVKRAILARELSAADIARLAKDTSLELEVFVHGALCVAYSGQCFTSAAFGGRSANRGECAQACRLPYQLLVDDVRRDLGEMKYVLSPLDLMGIDALPDLIAAGVVSFKIEGRLKSPEYVAATTALYRKALDQILTADDRRLLAQGYSRGGSAGFLQGTNHQTILEGTFPGHRGVFVGKVVGHDERNNRLEIAPTENIKANDGLLFTAPTLDPQNKNGPGGRVSAVVRGKESIFLEFEKRRFGVADVPVGARVFRTHDPAADAILQKIIQEDAGNRVAISMTVSGKINQPLVLQVVDGDGHAVTVQSPETLVPAANAGLTHEILHEKLGRLGDTVYVLKQLSLDLPEGAHLPVRVLNQLRRQATAALDEARQRPAARTLGVQPIAKHFLNQPVARGVREKPQIIPLCRTPEHVQGVLAAGGVAAVMLDFMELVGLKKALERVRAAGLRVIIAPPRISKPGEEKILDALLAFAPDEMLVRSLGQLHYLHKNTQIPLRGDFSLNVANGIAARFFIERGLQSVVPSYDLSMVELEKFYEDFPATHSELVVHQYIPMFHTEYCAYAKLLSPGLGFKGTSYEDCGRPCEQHRMALEDREGEQHPVVVDVGCRNTIFSAQANSIADELMAFCKRGVARFRVELLKENAEATESLIQNYQAVLDGKLSGVAARQASKAIHRLGVLRI